MSCSRLGSINHTLSALEILKLRGLSILGIVYNRIFDGSESITQDSRRVFANYLRKYGHQENIVDMFSYSNEKTDTIPDFAPFFK